MSTLSICAVAALCALSQAEPVSPAPGSPPPVTIPAVWLDRETGREADAGRADIRAVRELERDLNRIRATELQATNRPDLLASGFESVMARLEAFGDEPAALPLLRDVFERAPVEVRLPIVSMLFDRASGAADVELARWALDDADEEVRSEAERLLWTRCWADHVSVGVKRELADALNGSDHDRANRAAEVIETLELYEAIPAMINAQIVQRAATGAERGGGSQRQAWILVGTQRTFVADVTPIVGTGSVAFDPTIGVLTEGSLLVVRDAVATIYRHQVHSALVRMTSAASGQDTSLLGYNTEQWRHWLATTGREPVAIATATVGPGATQAIPTMAMRPQPGGAQVTQIDAVPRLPPGDPVVMPGRWDAPLIRLDVPTRYYYGPGSPGFGAPPRPPLRFPVPPGP